MSAGKRTPGPWAIDWNISRLDIHAGPTMVVSVRRPALDDEEAIANARLIAAAPDLLEALETLTGHCRRMGFDTREEEPLLQAAEAAIAKAAGADA